MPCFLVMIAVFFPRIALVIMWLVNYSQRAFDTMLWPVLGFIFMPFTTCAWVLAENEFAGPEGIGLFLIIVGVIFDLGSHGGAGRSRVVRYRRVRG